MYDTLLAQDRARLIRLHVWSRQGTAAGLLAEQLLDDPEATCLALWWEGRSRLAEQLHRLSLAVAP